MTRWPHDFTPDPSRILERAGLPSKEAPNSYTLYEQVAYDEYWNSPGNRKLDQLEHAIVNELLPRDGCRVIDVGCGYGRLSDTYIGRFDSAILFDGSRSLLKRARAAIGPAATYVWGDVNYLPFCESAFDAALVVRVLHHIPDAKRFLGQLRQVLCGGGILVLSYSNKRNAFRVLRYLAGFAPPNPFAVEPLAVEPNFIHHHPRYISDTLSSSGFSVSAYRGAGVIDRLASIPGPLGDRIPPGICAARALGHSGLAPWIFCRAAAEDAGAPKRPSSSDDVLRCLACGSGLERTAGNCVCTGCHRAYPVIDGIIDMRPIAAAGKRVEQ